MLGRAKAELGYRPFLALLAAGVVVRVAAMVLYKPAWMQSLDSLRYARIVPTGIFSDYWMPAVYATYVRALREVVPALWVSIGMQHLIGLSIGISLFLAMRWLGARAWLACIPAGVAFLSGDEVWIEHQIMAEPFVTALIAAGLAASIHGLVPSLNLGWLAAGSALLMLAGLSRNVALAILPIMVVGVVLWVREPARLRLHAVLAAILPALVVLGSYVAAFEISNGRYLGIANMSGWNLYARVAPFADCSKFTPPAGTRRLCEPTPASDRVGSLGYQWDTKTIGRRNFELGPATSPVVGDFAQEAVLHQSLSYLKAVAVDAARYIEPDIGPDRPLSGLPHDVQSFGLEDPVTRRFMVEQMSHGYTGTQVDFWGRDALATYQDFFRVRGFLLAALLVLTLIGMWIARGSIRLGLYLFGATALALYLIPVATLSYEVRYGLPPQPFLVASGVLGLVALLERRKRALRLSP